MTTNKGKAVSMLDRGSILLAPRVLAIETSSGSYKVKGPVSMLGLADGSVLFKGWPRSIVPKGKARAVVYSDPAKSKRERKSVDLPWRHDVKSVTEMHLTSQGLLMTSKQSPLWAVC